MYCTHCEKLVSDKTAVRGQFCPYCGRKLHWFGIPEVELSKPIMQAILKRKNFLLRQHLEGIKNHYFKQQNPENIFVELQDALNFNPDNIKAIFNMGLYYLEKNRIEKAIPFFKKVLQKDNQHLDALFNLSNISAQKGNYQEAINYCEMIIKIDHNNLNALYNRAVGYYYLGDLESALQEFKKLVLIDENNQDILKAIAELSGKLN